MQMNHRLLLVLLIPTSACHDSLAGSTAAARFNAAFCDYIAICCRQRGIPDGAGACRRSLDYSSQHAGYDARRGEDCLTKLKVLAEALLEYETIEGAEIDQLFAGKRLDRKSSVAWTQAVKARADKAAVEAVKAEAAQRPSLLVPPTPEKA